MPEALSIDSAVAQLDAGHPEDGDTAPAADAAAAEAPVAPPEAGEPQTEETPSAEPPADADAGPEDAPVTDAEEGTQDPAHEPAIEAPQSWNAQEREEFATLPRAAQAIIASREAERDSRLSRAMQEINDGRKADQQHLNTFAQQVAQTWPKLVESFQSKWGPNGPDLVKVLAEHGPEEAMRQQIEWGADRDRLRQAAQVQAEANRVAHENWVKIEAETLRKIAPTLAHPETGAKLRGDVVKYGIDSGAITQADIPNISAAQLLIAYKAMLWDQSQSKAAAAARAPANKTPAAPTPSNRAPARQVATPTAAAAPQTNTRAQQQVASRFAQTRSLDDAVALLDARR